MIESVGKKCRSEKIRENSFLLDSWKKSLSFLTSYYNLCNPYQVYGLPGRWVGLADGFYCKFVISMELQVRILLWTTFDFWIDLANNSYSELDVRGALISWHIAYSLL